jgi:anti-sigma factor RsiW
MNCCDLEAIIIEMARDRLMDGASRERGLEHIQRCASCATLLIEERALNRDLRSLSARCAAEEIPERIETALLTAFRQASPAPIVAPRRRRWLPAAAALALLTFGISLAGWIATSPRRGAPVVSTAGGGGPTNIPATPVVDDQKPPRVVEVRQRYRRPRNATNALSVKRQKRSSPANRRLAGDDAPREFVTQFFPVMQGGELIPLEGGQLVRVRMPRSNLISLGIPFNQERASDTIKADVLVSNDGLARAIRLVY